MLKTQAQTCWSEINSRGWNGKLAKPPDVLTCDFNNQQNVVKCENVLYQVDSCLWSYKIPDTNMRYKHCTGQQFILRFISTQDHPVTDVGCVKERGDFKLCDTNITAEVLNLQDNHWIITSLTKGTFIVQW